jgi:Zn-dependent M16 (insulinase) family peptidase
MLNLRVSTSNEKVQSYHHGYYRPDNLCLVITGQIEASQIFETLKPFEDKILSKVTINECTCYFLVISC